ncbi:MAG: hypothetical protein HOP19_19325 [Acidobacteria bacterium]|nr:hypothetical protein [Acidobacteriota bacterium]
MKSLALRVFACFALAVLAHNIKPFTGANLITFVGASVRSMREWLPESALNKVSVVAAVVNRAWQKDTGVAPQPLNLLANLPAARNIAGKLPSQSRTLRRLKVQVAHAPESQVALETESEDVSSAEESAVSWQPETTEETPAPETAPVLPSISTGKSTVESSLWSPLPKREACEMPVTTETENPPPPVTEITPEIKPTRPMRTTNSLEPEIQPVVLVHPSKPPTVLLLYLGPARKIASKC